MPDDLAVLRDRIESDYEKFQGMDSDSHPYRLAGHGRSEFATLYNLGEDTSVSWETDHLGININKGLFEGEDESIPLGNGKLEVFGHLTPSSVYNSDIYLFPRDGLLKAVAGCYSHKAKIKQLGMTKKMEFWPHMLLNYLKGGEFDIKEAFVTFRVSAGIEEMAEKPGNESIRKAIHSAQTVKRVWEKAKNYRHAVALSEIDPFTLAQPETIEVEGEFGFVFGGLHKDKIRGKLILKPCHPSDYSVFKIPCAARSEFCQIPNIQNDIARTDGIRKKNPTLLKGRNAAFYIEDAGKVRKSFDYMDLGVEIVKSGMMTGALAAGAGFLGAASVFVASYLYSGLPELCSYTGLYDWDFSKGFDSVSKYIIFGTIVFSGLGVVIGLDISKDHIVHHTKRKLKGNPLMDYWVRAEQP